MTKQHIFGKRLLKLLDEKIGSHLVIENLPDTPRVMKQKSGNVWSKQIRRVCRICNENWMRLLEEETHEILCRLIRGETKIPLSSHRALAARFAQMVMVASLSVPSELDAISLQERHHLRIKNEAPPNWVILLARADVRFKVAQYYSSDAFRGIALKADNSPEIVKNLVVTFLLGKLCVQVLTRIPNNFLGYQDISLAQLWPPLGIDINLEESSILNEAMVVRLAKAIRDDLNNRKRSAGLS
jgi:hypothetical protein